MRRPVAVLAASLVMLTVTCKSDGGTATLVPTTVTVSPNTVNFNALGQTQALTASVLDQNGSPMSSAVTWSTDNGAVAGVTTAGVVSATGSGSTTVHATAGSAQGSATVNVVLVATILTGITPDTLVEGQAATLTGNGFAATPANNTVMIGGVAAVVTAALPTSLTVTVPAFGCQPARDVNVTVTVGGITSNTVSRRLHPTSFVNLAVGQQLNVANPAQFCLQFRPSATGGDGYLVGVGAAAEIPTSLLPFSLTTVTGGAAATAAAMVAAPRTMPGPPLATGSLNLDLLAWRVAQARAERQLRAWEVRNLPRLAAGTDAEVALRSAASAMAPPVVGDTIRFRIANLASPTNLCDTVRSVLTTVRAVGTAGVWVTDNNNPATDALTLAEIQAYSDTFDTKIYAVDTLYFGTPSDIDNNQRVFIVLTIEVNKFPVGVAGYVFSGDFFSRNLCVGSNQGEVFYGQVPDPANVAGTGARSKANILFQMPSLMAHEFTHNIQFARRLVLASGITLSSWESEGQATLAEEVVGHSVLGNTPGQNYGPAVAFGTNAGERWYAGGFVSLAQYYGWDGSGTTAGDTVANAPAACTLFGSSTLVTNCDAFAFYGVSWSFLRYLSDRFGPTYPGGEAQLHRDVIGKTIGSRGVANIQALIGVNFDSVFAQWGGMLYADDRVPGVGTPLTMTSWNMLNIYNAVIPSARLRPTDRNWSAFSDSRSVRGGSNAYTRIVSGGARPALALRVRDPADATLATTMRPQLWIVRVQ